MAQSPAQLAEVERRTAAVQAALAEHGRNISKISRDTGLTRRIVRFYLQRTGKDKVKPVAAGDVDTRRMDVLDPPPHGEVHRYICTAAQNNTKAHSGFLRNLEALAKHHGAAILVSRFSYNKNAYSAHDPKPDTKAPDEFDGMWYDPRLTPYFSDERVQLAPGLVWCGEMNILPTAVRPLSGFETYTGRASGIFPHAKIALESVVAMAGEGTKFNYTTGAVTLRNYIQKKAGLKADFHHAFGALLVEVDSDGNWFCRHLNASSDGTFYDLDLKVQKGKVTKGHRVEAINWGDFHAAQTDPMVFEIGWTAPGSMIDVLRPRIQFMHDLFDMRWSHHIKKNCHKKFELHVTGANDVHKELIHTAEAMSKTARPWCKTVVVDSNHDGHLGRWLRDEDHRDDPVNARFYLAAQERVYRSIEERDKKFHLLEWALRRINWFNGPKKAKFLREDESFVICKAHGGGIECGMHGHLGPNGTRGSLKGLSKLGRKFNIGHSHSPGILDGGYQAGTSSILRLDYIKGPSSHSHSHILTYRNGKRTIITMYKGKWRA